MAGTRRPGVAWMRRRRALTVGQRDHAVVGEPRVGVDLLVPDQVARRGREGAGDVDALHEARVGDQHVDRRVAGPAQRAREGRHVHHRALAVIEAEATDEATDTDGGAEGASA